MVDSPPGLLVPAGAQLTMKKCFCQANRRFSKAGFIEKTLNRPKNKTQKVVSK
jgi:hypothetical protein